MKLYTAQGYVSGGSDNPTTAATGLVLDGPDFVLSGSEPWRGRLVNTEGYALPESIHVVYRYDYGYEYELTENAMYNGYTYDRTTGDIVVSAPYGSSTTVVIRADGTEKAGNPAGALSGVTYDRPDSTYGPFNWTVTEGGGKLETAEDVNVNGTRKNVAYYTPSEPGVSYLTATTKDGQYHVNFAVVCLPVQANTLRLDDTRATLHPLETLALNATLTPTPTRAEPRRSSVDRTCSLSPWRSTSTSAYWEMTRMPSYRDSFFAIAEWPIGSVSVITRPPRRCMATSWLHRVRVLGWKNSVYRSLLASSGIWFLEYGSSSSAALKRCPSSSLL